jgi:hypothetical protein
MASSASRLKGTGSRSAACTVAGPVRAGQDAARKAGVVADAHGVDLAHQPRELVEVPLVDAAGRPQ